MLSLADEPENRPAEADVQCFDYDYLRRMTEAWSQAQKPCASMPEQSAVGGAAAYWTSYRFNTAGGRTSMVEHVPTGDVSTSYDYNTAGKPNAVSAVSDSIGQNETFTWDAAGNLESRSANGRTESFTWNEAGKPVEIDTGAGTAKMFYTAGGERIARIDADGSVTAFVAGQELTRAAGSGAAVGTRYYTHEGAVFASRTAGKDLVWLAEDHRGTAVWSVNSRTLTSSVKRRDPFGGPRVHFDPDYWPAGQRGFVGGTQDPTGYVQLGARSYDPGLGMFVSVDPLGVPLDPQRMHPYAYSNNNPLTFSDPSGLSHCHGWECSYVGNGSHTDPNGPGGSSKKKSAGGSGGPLNLGNSKAKQNAANPYWKNHSVADSSRLEYKSLVWYMYSEMFFNSRSATVYAISHCHGMALPILCEAGAYKLWYDKVKTEGKWDHKNRILDTLDMRKRGTKHSPMPRTVGAIAWDVWSNMHYGYVGTDAGFAEWELHAGADVADLIGQDQTDEGVSIQVGS